MTRNATFRVGEIARVLSERHVLPLNVVTIMSLIQFRRIQCTVRFTILAAATSSNFITYWVNSGHT